MSVETICLQKVIVSNVSQTLNLNPCHCSERRMMLCGLLRLFPSFLFSDFLILGRRIHTPPPCWVSQVLFTAVTICWIRHWKQNEMRSKIGTATAECNSAGDNNYVSKACVLFFCSRSFSIVLSDPSREPLRSLILRFPHLPNSIPGNGLSCVGTDSARPLNIPQWADSSICLEK